MWSRNSTAIDGTVKGQRAHDRQPVRDSSNARQLLANAYPRDAHGNGIRLATNFGDLVQLCIERLMLLGRAVLVEKHAGLGPPNATSLRFPNLVQRDRLQPGAKTLRGVGPKIGHLLHEDCEN